MKINRQKFYAGYKKFFGSQTQATVDALNVILDKFETEKRLKNISQFAYVLATAYHESGINGNHFVPVKEGKARVGSKVWEKYQKKYWNTGYYGRGLIQTTWREKYAAIGELLGVGDLFVRNPDLLLDINWAYEALVAGMVNGIYRSDKSKRKYTLQRFLKSDDETTENYIEAREIVNGDKEENGRLIAGYAQHFEQILRESSSTNPAQGDASRELNPANFSAEQFVETPKAAGEDAVAAPSVFNSGGGNSDIAGANQSPSQAADNSEAKTEAEKGDDKETLCKERPSTFVRWFVAVKAFLGYVIAGIGSLIGLDDIKEVLKENAGKLDVAVVEILLIALLKTGLIVGAGVLLVYLATKLYDKAANRANALNMQKLVGAQSKDLNTTEFKS